MEAVGPRYDKIFRVRRHGLEILHDSVILSNLRSGALDIATFRDCVAPCQMGY